jgi:hypothetical protein
MVRTLAILALLAALAFCCAAKGGVDFINERFFRFGMDQGDAETVLTDAKNWKIMYRVDTTTASSIACVYQGQLFYQVDFYQGRCYRVEKRAELPQEQVDPTYKYYLDKYGDKTQMSPEGKGDIVEISTSSDEKLVFARWNKKDRVISLTADARDAGVYLVTYEEYDPITQMDAEHEMDQEINNSPQEVDPITGKARPIQPQPDAGEGQDNGGPKDNGKKDDSKKDDGKKDDGGSGGGDDGGDGHDID